MNQRGHTYSRRLISNYKKYQIKSGYGKTIQTKHETKP